MWEKLTQESKNSFCIVNKKAKLLKYVYWRNFNSKKLTGINIKLKQEVDKNKRVIEYVLSTSSFNILPINYIELIEVDNEHVKTIQ